MNKFVNAHAIAWAELILCNGPRQMPKDVDKGSLRFFYAPSSGICPLQKPVFSDKIVLRSH